uniref:Uncharacterized protein n=1 Tax=Cryptophlebia leucotreta granulosis virus TaxID=35254 RepID=A0A2H4ZKK7_GVCL|nr:hypothetical protein [Cryptophlebia leucotreta granulovirus]
MRKSFSLQNLILTRTHLMQNVSRSQNCGRSFAKRFAKYVLQMCFTNVFHEFCDDESDFVSRF